MQVIQNQVGNLYRAGDWGQLACWNWALTGCYHSAVWPSLMFDYVTTGLDGRNSLDHHGRSWFRNQANADRLGQVQGTWVMTASDTPDAARTVAVDAVMRLAIEANGLTLSAAGGTAVTPYRLFVEYKTRMDGGAAGDLPPSFHHMWIDVHGRAIELFPGMSNIQIYQGRQPIDMARFAVWDCYLTGLHQRQVDRIVKVIRDARANWTVVPAVPATRQPWIVDATRAGCLWCGVIFSTLRRRHHCRRCGEIFCDSCSSFTRAVVNPATRPGDQAAGLQNDARVCVRCNG
ncbi:FYVE-type zinc finger protein [Luteibacter rhizovicinus]|uniref:FYVE-type zinc finger protein n=2 Tax=Luteibacter rhizovicinus TaxID=242606 RepID=A0A4R3YS80_9GAMM|nr:FYVE-type zinc finger protein [Luteibacter rhizovicinus]